jgi:hypothetical protein
MSDDPNEARHKREAVIFRRFAGALAIALLIFGVAQILGFRI